MVNSMRIDVGYTAVLVIHARTQKERLGDFLVTHMANDQTIRLVVRDEGHNHIAIAFVKTTPGTHLQEGDRMETFDF